MQPKSTPQGPSPPHDTSRRDISLSTTREAEQLRELRREGEVARALLEAETMFKAVLDQKQNDAGAWNGIGSVLVMRGQPKEALFYIRQALALAPNYKDATHDEKI